jgi:hypothetical protein
MRAMTIRIMLISLLVLSGSAFMAHLAHAGTPAEAPIAAAAAVPDDCAQADAEVTSRLQPAMIDSRRLPAGMTLGDALASLYKARTLCRQGAPSQGMLVYIRLSDALTDPTGLKRR